MYKRRYCVGDCGLNMKLCAILLFLLAIGPNFEVFNGTTTDKFISDSPNFLYWANINFSFNFNLPEIAIEFDCLPPNEDGWQVCESRELPHWWFGP